MADEIAADEKPAEPASLTTLAIDGREIVIVRTKTTIAWKAFVGEEKWGNYFDPADPWGDEAKEMIIADAIKVIAEIGARNNAA